MNKRTYTLSEAAKQQRRLASQSAQEKRAQRFRGLATVAVPVPTDDDIGRTLQEGNRNFNDIFAPLPKDAPNSEHQSRAARIRVHMLKTGQIAGLSRGGRRHVARPCLRCNVECSTAREARDHCRKPRAK